MPGANGLLIGASRRSTRAGSSGISLGPNLITAPNGTYISAPWSTTNVGETAGQTDPLGGSNARLLNDGVAAGQHYVFYNGLQLTLGQKYLLTAFIKPGTYAGSAITLEVFVPGGAIAAADFNLSPKTLTANAGNTMTLSNLTTSAVANGFWRASFNFVCSLSAANTEVDVSFGPSFPSYTGTSANYTLFGVSLQTST